MVTDPTAASSPEPRLGDYELLSEIASGGMATVYLGRKVGAGGFERHVAIKCCHPHLKRDPTFVAMFLDEARLASRIHHPNVVATLEVSDIDALYFVMEYIEGASLAEWLKRTHEPRSPETEALILRVIVDALFGLHAAHELRDSEGKPLNLVHRDVSPQNLLIGLDGVTRIADFGIAKAESRLTRTRTGQVKGKTGYMPPEQILGEPLDRRADVYAAGVVLWEALTGRRLFDSDSDAATINQVLNNAVPAPSTLSAVSPTLDELVLRALKFEPDERYSSALKFAEALQSSGLVIASTGEVGAVIDTVFGREIHEKLNDFSPVRPETPSALRASDKSLLRRPTSNLRWLLIALVVLVAGLVAALVLSLRHSQDQVRFAPYPTPATTLEPNEPPVAPSDTLEPTPKREAPVAVDSSTHPTRLRRAPSTSSATPVTSNPLGHTQHIAPPVATTSEPQSPRQLPKSKPSEFRPTDL